MINKSEGNPNSGEYKKLYRGIWADKLENGDELPVGGSIFSTELTSRLRLDFENFDNQLEGFTADSLAEHYHKGEEAIRSWIEKFKLDVDPALFYVCFSVQAKVDKLLEANKVTDEQKRNKKYSDGVPSLSEFVGNSMCAERATLAQYIFQKLEMESSYMSGITMNNAEDTEECPVDHSFLVVKDRDGKPLVFDVARPISEQRYPRVMRADFGFNAEMFEGEDNLLAQTSDVITGQEMYFGVGDKEEGRHKVIKGK